MESEKRRISCLRRRENKKPEWMRWERERHRLKRDRDWRRWSSEHSIFPLLIRKASLRSSSRILSFSILPEIECRDFRFVERGSKNTETDGCRRWVGSGLKNNINISHTVFIFGKIQLIINLMKNTISGNIKRDSRIYLPPKRNHFFIFGLFPIYRINYKKKIFIVNFLVIQIIIFYSVTV